MFLRNIRGQDLLASGNNLAAAKASEGKGATFGDQEAVGGDTQRGTLVEAAPGTPLKVVEPQFLLEFQKVAFDTPMQLGQPD